MTARLLQIVRTTDGKFVGHTFELTGDPVTINGFTFDPAREIEDLGGGRWVIANSNYRADCIEVEE